MVRTAAVALARARVWASSVACGFCRIARWRCAVAVFALLTCHVHADWPMHRGGPQLQGRSEMAAPAEPKLAWTFNAGKPVKAAAAIAGGKVFFGDDGGIVHALNLADGREVWTFKTEGAIEAAPPGAGHPRAWQPS